MIILFYFSLILIAYVYVGYPLIAVVLGRLLGRHIQKKQIAPSVTVLVAAFNEREVIEATVRNKLTQEYPPEQLEVIVISDASTDGTDDIVRGLGDPRVRLLRQEPRAGKTSALNMAVPLARGEIIVFSDANSIYAPDAIRHLVGNFSDPDVGYVTGRMIYANPDGSTIGDGCTAYMRYENALRASETHLGSVVGVDGGIDAVRAPLYRPMQPDQLPDFVLPLMVIEQGHRVVYEPQALLWEQSLKSPGDEYRMRVRVTLRALWALFTMRRLLAFSGNKRFAWQLWSHKVLRYLCFIFLIAALVSNTLLLAHGPLYQGAFVIQVAGYLGALLMPVLERKGYGFRGLALARYFVLLNVAAAHAFLKFLTGKKQVLWTPRKG